MAAPEAPEGVRWVHPDGREIPVELVYEGCDDEGIHRWTATGTIPQEDGWDIAVALFPAKTQLSFALTPIVAIDT